MKNPIIAYISCELAPLQRGRGNAAPSFLVLVYGPTRTFYFRQRLTYEYDRLLGRCRRLPRSCCLWSQAQGPHIIFSFHFSKIHRTSTQACTQPINSWTLRKYGLEVDQSPSVPLTRRAWLHMCHGSPWLQPQINITGTSVNLAWPSHHSISLAGSCN